MAVDEPEDRAWNWLESQAFGDPNDREYGADEMVDAYMAGHRSNGPYDVARLAKQHAAMRKALAPFAELGAWLFAQDLPDETPMVEIKGINGHRRALTRGMFKAAFTARQSSSD